MVRWYCQPLYSGHGVSSLRQAWDKTASWSLVFHSDGLALACMRPAVLPTRTLKRSLLNQQPRPLGLSWAPRKQRVSRALTQPKMAARFPDQCELGLVQNPLDSYKGNLLDTDKWNLLDKDKGHEPKMAGTDVLEDLLDCNVLVFICGKITITSEQLK